jgi:hypothetical protein
MKHLKQPRGSSLCGQACVAMVAECSLVDAVAAVKRVGGTRTKDLVRGLKAYGFSVHGRLIPWRGEPLPKLAIVKVKFPRRARFHWVLVRKDFVFDPLRRGPTVFHPALWRERKGRVTAYLPIPTEPRRRKR